MPLVTVRYKTSVLDTRPWWFLTDGSLAQIIAEALSCGEGKLVADDIVIETKPVLAHNSEHFNRSQAELQIVIDAHDFPERRANLEERKDRIIEGILKIPQAAVWSGFVWIRLMPTAFGKFEKKKR